MTTYASNELVSSSEVAKKFGSYLAQIANSSIEKLAVLKNNKVEAVMLSKDNYEIMIEKLKIAEANGIISSIEAGLADVQNGKTKGIETLWDKL